MKRTRLVASLVTLGFATAVAVLGCRSLEDSPLSVETDSDPVLAGKAIAQVTGGGRYLLSGVFDIQFSVSAIAKENGGIAGNFHQSLVLEGQLVEFHGEVTCVTVDAELGRGWIGGIITENNSEHPDFTTEINEPGRDVWFRVLDGGADGPDRLTFLGFEGGGGIITSDEYCEATIWPDDNARTHPVTSGQIKVSP